MSNKRIRKKRAKKRETAIIELAKLTYKMLCSSIPPSRNWFSLTIPEEVKVQMPEASSPEIHKFLEETRDRIAESVGFPTKYLKSKER